MIKSQIPNPKNQINSKHQKLKVYDLEERTYKFAQTIGNFCQNLPRSITNIEYGRQLIRSAGSVGANYIEANEALGKKDFLMRIKICRKEAKESAYWLRLIISTNKNQVEIDDNKLLQEAIELKKIFSTILQNSQ